MSLSGRALTSGLCNIDEQHDRNHRQKQLETLFAKLASADPQTVAVLFVMEAFLCPTCSQALKISTIEPHPTRDGVDVVRTGALSTETFGRASPSTKQSSRYGNRRAATMT